MSYFICLKFIIIIIIIIIIITINELTMVAQSQKTARTQHKNERVMA